MKKIEKIEINNFFGTIKSIFLVNSLKIWFLINILLNGGYYEID